MHKIVFSSSARKDARKLPKVVWFRIRPHIRNLSNTPFPQGCKKFSGTHSFYRIRIGNYRVVYYVDKVVKVVTITRIGHRKEAYSK